MNKPDPYADLVEVYAEETSLKKFLATSQPTPKTLTDEDVREKTLSAKWARLRAILGGEEDGLPMGYHIDGDPRYFER